MKPCTTGDPRAPESGIPCCSGCACTCGTDFPFTCECHPPARPPSIIAEALNVLHGPTQNAEHVLEALRNAGWALVSVHEVPEYVTVWNAA